MPEIEIRTTQSGTSPNLDERIQELARELASDLRLMVAGVINREAPAEGRPELGISDIVVYRCQPFLPGTQNAHPLEVQVMMGSDNGRRGAGARNRIKDALYVKLQEWLAPRTNTETRQYLNGGIETVVSFKDSSGSTPLANGRTRQWG